MENLVVNDSENYDVQSVYGLLAKFKENEISETIKSLTGIIKVEDLRNFDWKQEKYEYLMGKYFSI